nr:MAG TPA: hypothetical protein [Caudoviricetes sp.]
MFLKHKNRIKSLFTVSYGFQINLKSIIRCLINQCFQRLKTTNGQQCVIIELQIILFALFLG